MNQQLYAVQKRRTISNDKMDSGFRQHQSVNLDCFVADDQIICTTFMISE